MAPAILFYDFVLWIHVSAVVIGFGGAFTYPLWFAALRKWDPVSRAGFHRVQHLLGQRVISPMLLVIFIAGAYMASDRDLWSEAWVTVPVVIAIVLGGLGGAYFGPRERRLAELAEGGGGAEYDSLFTQVRTVTYAALGLVLIAAFFMVTKPGG